MPIATALLALIQYAPSAISEVRAVYAAIKGDLSETDIAQIDAALKTAEDTDALATMAADVALDAASKR